MSVHLAAYHQETGTGAGELLATGRAGTGATDPLYEQAAARGEIGTERLSERVKSLPFDLLRHEILTTYAPVPDQVLEEIVDTVFLPLVR